ncbi:MAG: iron-containing alcohol dehydrogenase [Eubacteriales bacterium]|nr:iron-containing alcohol dehydrogenase [Bacillota bacterium]
MELYKFVSPEIIFGRGALEQVGESLVRLGVKKVFIVSDPGVMEAGWVDKAVPPIKEAGLDYIIWHDITSNPKDHEVHKGLEKYLETGCNAVLGIGGGSSIDTAKAIALLSTNGGHISDFEGADKVQQALPPIVAVPTTAGSGAEVTQLAVVTNTKRQMKMVIGSKSLVPDISLIDPRTLTTKDKQLTANTGMDALTHAIEAYVSLAATPLTDIQALNAIKLATRYLPVSVSNRTNLEAKDAMAMASLQAGLALSNAILGLVHAMSHQLGGLLDMPHGEANAILLPSVMEYNLSSAIERFGSIAEAMDQRVFGLSRRDAAQKAIEAVRRLAKDIGILEKLPEVGLTDELLIKLSENAMVDVCIITNPKEVQVDDILKLFTAVL